MGGWVARRGWVRFPSALCSLVEEEEEEGGRGPAAERGCARRSVLLGWRRHLTGSTASKALFSFLFLGYEGEERRSRSWGWVTRTAERCARRLGTVAACCFLKLQGQRRAGKRSAGILVSSTRQGLPGVGLWLLGPETATGVAGPDRAGIGIGGRSRRGAISGAEKLSGSGALHCIVKATVVKMQAVRAGWLTSRKERCGSVEESQRMHTKWLDCTYLKRLQW